jgi:hypothetical protein
VLHALDPRAQLRFDPLRVRQDGPLAVRLGGRLADGFAQLGDLGLRPSELGVRLLERTLHRVELGVEARRALLGPCATGLRERQGLLGRRQVAVRRSQPLRFSRREARAQIGLARRRGLERGGQARDLPLAARVLPPLHHRTRLELRDARLEPGEFLRALLCEPRNRRELLGARPPRGLPLRLARAERGFRLAARLRDRALLALLALASRRREASTRRWRPRPASAARPQRGRLLGPARALELAVFAAPPGARAPPGAAPCRPCPS